MIQLGATREGSPFRHVGRTWTDSSAWCVDCDASLPAEAVLDACGPARCQSCRVNLELEVAAGPTTAFLTRFEPAGPAASRSGDSASGLCASWLNIATGATSAVDEGAFADPLVPLVPCSRPAHEGDAHAWDRRSWRATLDEARRAPRAVAAQRHRTSHVDGSLFRALREEMGLTRNVAAARYGARWGRGGSLTNIYIMERNGGSKKLLERATLAYRTEIA